MKWLDAIERVLREVGTPTGYRDLANTVVREQLVATESQTPDITLHASVSQDIRRRRSRGLPPRFTISAGDIGLAEWSTSPPDDAVDTIERSRSRAKQELLRKLRELDGAQFESFLELLFTKMGYDVAVTGGARDDGIDLIAALSGGIGAQSVGVQAKCLGPRREIGPNPIRLLRDALPAQECNAGAVVATCRFNADAVRVAQEPGRPPIKLIGPKELTDLALEFRVGVRSETIDLFVEDLESAMQAEGASTV
jgi:restriction endonuclease Mrr